MKEIHVVLLHTTGLAGQCHSPGMSNERQQKTSKLFLMLLDYLREDVALASL